MRATGHRPVEQDITGLRHQRRRLALQGRSTAFSIRVFDVVTGDLVVMPSWSAVSIETETGLDLFAFNDRPIIETLNFARTHVEGEQQ